VPSSFVCAAVAVRDITGGVVVEELVPPANATAPIDSAPAIARPEITAITLFRRVPM
jgi:hypothetical protein